MGLPDRNMHNGPKSKIKSNNTGSLMLQAIRNFLIHATPSQRCILAVSLNTPFLLAFMAAQSAGLWVPEWREYLVPKYMIIGNLVLGSAVLLQWALVVVLWRRRLNPEPRPKTSVFLATIVGVAFAYEAFLGGNLTFPTNLVIVGIIPIGLLILDRRSVAFGVAIGMLFYWANDLAI